MSKVLIKKLIKFREKRDWGKFHTPLNLIMSLQLEVSEVMEYFQWKTNEEFELLIKNNPKKYESLKEELADVYAYLLLLSHVLDIDLKKALIKKIKINDSKYPVKKIKGSAKKYNEI